MRSYSNVPGVAHPPSFRCHVYPQAWLTRLGMRRFGLHFVELGREPFDDQFAVETNDETRARSVLTDEVQQGLLNLKQWVGGSLEWTVEMASLRVRIVGFVMSGEDLMTFYEASGRIYDAVREAIGR